MNYFAAHTALPLTTIGNAPGLCRRTAWNRIGDGSTLRALGRAAEGR